MPLADEPHEIPAPEGVLLKGEVVSTDPGVLVIRVPLKRGLYWPLRETVDMRMQRDSLQDVEAKVLADESSPEEYYEAGEVLVLALATNARPARLFVDSAVVIDL